MHPRPVAAAALPLLRELTHRPCRQLRPAPGEGVCRDPGRRPGRSVSARLGGDGLLQPQPQRHRSAGSGPPGAVARTTTRRRRAPAGSLRRPLPGRADPADHPAAPSLAAPDPVRVPLQREAASIAGPAARRRRAGEPATDRSRPGGPHHGGPSAGAGGRGRPIDEVFPEVPAADFRQVILSDLEWIGAHSTRIYGVLNACRILAYLDGQGLLSKAEGADWALSNVPATYRATITKARSAYRHGKDEPCSPQEVQAFARWAAAKAAQGPQRR